MVEIEGEGQVPALPGEGAALVAFMSFAVSRGFGAQHPLLALAELAARSGISLGPLTTFYEGTPEDAEDMEKLELAWQAAGPLHDSVAALAALVETNAEAVTLLRRAGMESLAAELGALAGALEPAVERAGRARLSYEL